MKSEKWKVDESGGGGEGGEEEEWVITISAASVAGQR